MQITPVRNNVNFGYNKRLNNQLVKRLEQNPELPVNQTLLEINQSCNETEKRIRKLEGPNQEKVDKNEDAINILADYFQNAKLYLCKTVDRIFPDLNFTQKECDTYDEENSEIELPQEAESQDGIRSAYLWRDNLIDAMINDKAKTQKLHHAPTADDLDDEEFIQQTLMNAAMGGKADPSTFVEKFHPFSYSPKSLDDIVGVKQSVEDVRDLIVFSINHPEEAKQREKEYGIKIPGFAVLFGPPGCGKTMMAEAIAAETGCDMYMMDLSKFGSSYVNGTTKNVADAFEYVKEQAKKSDKPVILFMDEMDSVLKKREASDSGSSEDNKVVNALLPQLVQAKDNNILVIGATNMYDALDTAAKRRADLKCYVGLPKEEEIPQLLKNKLSTFEKGKTLANNDKALEKIAKDLVGYSPSNINSMVEQASKISYKEARETEAKDIKTALKEGNWEKINEEEYLPENKKPVKKLGFQP